MVNLVAATGSVRFTGRWAETKAALFDPLSVLIGLLPRNRWKRLAVLAAMAQGVRGEHPPRQPASWPAFTPFPLFPPFPASCDGCWGCACMLERCSAESVVVSGGG
jgi:hypothetical protein